MSEHATRCEWGSFQVCTCGVFAREREARQMELTLKLRAENAEKNRRNRIVWEKEARRVRRQWFYAKTFWNVAFVAAFHYLGWWIPLPVFTLYMLLAIPAWLLTAHGFYQVSPQPRYQGPWGFFRFFFW
jgi:hypothetical protein